MINASISPKIIITFGLPRQEDYCNSCGTVLEIKYYSLSSLEAKFCTKKCVMQYIKEDIKLEYL